MHAYFSPSAMPLFLRHMFLLADARPLRALMAGLADFGDAAIADGDAVSKPLHLPAARRRR